MPSNIKNIKFSHISEESKQWSLDPIPAVNDLPHWYKKANRFRDEDKKVSLTEQGKNLTIKACSPVFDSMSAGYFIRLSADVYVSQTEEGAYFRWDVSTPIVDAHSSGQVVSMPIRKGYQTVPFKWINLHNIYTPQGYSVLFQHPAYRDDLPFYCLSGIVDTDTFNYPVNFPFFIEEGYEGLIERGTPIAQVVPIKREHWKSQYGEVEKNMAARTQNVFAVLERFTEKLLEQEAI